MKIPKKHELLELQKKYRTDRKIGEVYGVPGRLVAYWRSKKGIPAFSQPKYSKETILDLWERYGNDRLAGAELEITGPAFRQWRLKYNIKSKPQQLKFRQLELPLIDIPRRSRNARRETLIQKIIARKAGLKYVDEADAVEVMPDLVTCGAEMAAVLGHFKKIGAARIWDKTRIVVVLDHRIHAAADHDGVTAKTLRDWARKQGIENFYDRGWGAVHQVTSEQGLTKPGDLIFGSNSYVSSCGGIGAVGLPATTLELASVWATGRIWYKIPPTVKVVLTGKIPRGLTAADIALRFEHDLVNHVVAGKAIEIFGDPLSALSLSSRMTLAGPVFIPAAAAIGVSIDEISWKNLRKFYRQKLTPINADPDARYADEIEINIGYLTPLVAHLEKGRDGLNPKIRAAEEFAGRKIDSAVIGGCQGGSFDDLALAAAIFRGRHINRDVQAIIIPGSRKTYLEADEKGYIRLFIESGCMVASPGCGHCQWPASGNDRVITTSACGDFDGEIFVASAATAAASAIDGVVTDPRKYLL